jgi:hypothetical protein
MCRIGLIVEYSRTASSLARTPRAGGSESGHYSGRPGASTRTSGLCGKSEPARGPGRRHPPGPPARRGNVNGQVPLPLPLALRHFLFATWSYMRRKRVLKFTSDLPKSTFGEHEVQGRSSRVANLPCFKCEKQIFPTCIAAVYVYVASGMNAVQGLGVVWSSKRASCYGCESATLVIAALAIAHLFQL